MIDQGSKLRQHPENEFVKMDTRYRGNRSHNDASYDGRKANGDFYDHVVFSSGKTVCSFANSVQISGFSEVLAVLGSERGSLSKEWNVEPALAKLSCSILPGKGSLNLNQQVMRLPGVSKYC